MEGVTIPDGMLNEFLTGYRSGSSEADPDQPLDLSRRGSETAIDWLIRIADSFAKKNELPGIADLSSKELAELIAVNIEKNFGAGIWERSPEMLLGTVISGLIGVNLIEYQRQKKLQAKKEPEKPEAENGSN